MSGSRLIDGMVLAGLKLKQRIVQDCSNTSKGLENQVRHCL
jgi:hypothetical protein